MLNRFTERYQRAYQQGMARKLGLSVWRQDDEALVEQLLGAMAEQQLDYTLTFRRLADLADPGGSAGRDVTAIASLPPALEPWLARWAARLQGDPISAGERQTSMYRANPAYIPRNHRIAQAIAAAVEQQDFAPFHRLLERLVRPFDYDPEQAYYATPPRPEEAVRQTFCGT